MHMLHALSLSRPGLLAVRLARALTLGSLLLAAGAHADEGLLGKPDRGPATLLLDTGAERLLVVTTVSGQAIAKFNHGSEASAQDLSAIASVYFSPIGTYLAATHREHGYFRVVNPTDVESTFHYLGLNFRLKQRIATEAQGFEFVQHYAVHNPGDTPQSFSLIGNTIVSTQYATHDRMRGARDFGRSRSGIYFYQASQERARAAVLQTTEGQGGSEEIWALGEVNNISDSFYGKKRIGPRLRNQVQTDANGDGIGDRQGSLAMAAERDYVLPAGGSIDFTLRTRFKSAKLPTN
jgi:hypothetical protein